MLGSGLAALVAVCEAAVALSNTVDRTAMAEGATKLDDILITRSPKCRPVRTALSVFVFSSKPEFPTSQHASAIPPGPVSVPAQEHLGFHALHVVAVRECVFAGR